MEVQKIEKSILNYELAVHFNPAHFEACNNLGAIYGSLDNAEMTMKWYSAALAINPTYFQTNNNLSIIYTTQGMTDHALRCSQTAIAANPMFAEAYNNLGVLYRDLGELRPAIEAYERCLVLCPTARNAMQNKLLALNYLPRTEEEECTTAHIEWGKEFVQQACAAYPGLATRRAVPTAPADGSPDEMDSEKDEEQSDSATSDAAPADAAAASGPAAATAAAGKAAVAAQLAWGSTPWVVDMREASEERPLTIGYISPDFFTHSVSYFIEGPLARHDRKKFRIICYANVPNGEQLGPLSIVFNLIFTVFYRVFGLTLGTLCRWGCEDSEIQTDGGRGQLAAGGDTGAAGVRGVDREGQGGYPDRPGGPHSEQSVGCVRDAPRAHPDDLDRLPEHVSTRAIPTTT